jgi:hypothetical protein
MKRSEKIYEKRKETFGKPADFNLIKAIIERGNSGDGDPAILEDSAYERLKNPKKSPVISLDLFMFEPTAEDLDQLASELPLYFTNKKLLRITDEEIEQLKAKMPMNMRNITKH